LILKHKKRSRIIISHQFFKDLVHLNESNKKQREQKPAEKQDEAEKDVEKADELINIEETDSNK
jgi:hypothetical protein